MFFLYLLILTPVSGIRSILSFCHFVWFSKLLRLFITSSLLFVKKFSEFLSWFLTTSCAFIQNFKAHGPLFQNSALSRYDIRKQSLFIRLFLFSFSDNRSSLFEQFSSFLSADGKKSHLFHSFPVS